MRIRLNSIIVATAVLTLLSLELTLINVRTWIQKPANDVIMEYSCEENNLGLEDGTIIKWKYPKVD